jgi:ABC-2 type transport system ATP-binding protein
MIQVNNVSMLYPVERRFGDYILHPFRKKERYLALKDIHLNIPSGKSVAFLGTNGAGKTTLLKLIGGLLYPTKGEIYVNGLNTMKKNKEARKSVGFILNEERSFYWRLTGRQNLEFFGALENLHGRILKDKIDELMDQVGLQEHAHRLVAGYSSGMKQRLAIARGLLSDPAILILDEPTRALDPEGVEEIRDLIVNRINRHEGRTLLIATHRMKEAEDLSDLICVMKKGRIMAQGSLEDIRSNYHSLSEFYMQTINSDNIYGPFKPVKDKSLH